MEVNHKSKHLPFGIKLCNNPFFSTYINAHVNQVDSSRSPIRNLNISFVKPIFHSQENFVAIFVNSDTHINQVDNDRSPTLSPSINPKSKYFDHHLSFNRKKALEQGILHRK